MAASIPEQHGIKGKMPGELLKGKGLKKDEGGGNSGWGGLRKNAGTE